MTKDEAWIEYYQLKAKLNVIMIEGLNYKNQAEAENLSHQILMLWKNQLT
jgi:hypothetical protein